jgi:zinc/manganese transport system substrate-binding protein
LLAASPEPSRTVLDIGVLARTTEGGNPHLWYAPGVVHAVAARLAERYSALDPAGSAYYARQLQRFRTQRLGRYDAVVSEIRSRYAGRAVGVSESIFVPMADALGLRIVTPESFIDAVSEGTDPTAASKALADRQIRDRQIAVFVYNDQNATPDVLALVASARRRHIPVVTVSETIPAYESFSEWQTAQLEALLVALRETEKK